MSSSALPLNLHLHRGVPHPLRVVQRVRGGIRAAVRETTTCANPNIEMKNREGQRASTINFRTFPKVRERCGTHRIKTITLAMRKGRPPASR